MASRSIGSASEAAAVDAHSNTALARARTNFAYLWNPSSPHAPASLRSRALLRSIRFFTIFLFWRLVRYAKYLAVGAAVSVLSATAIGSLVTPVGWIIAPTGILGTVGAGVLWYVGRWGFRKAKARATKFHADEASGKKPVREIPEPTFLSDTFT